MSSRRIVSSLLVLALSGAAACGQQDAPVADADPAGMGAGRPDTTASEEVPAGAVLEGAGAGPTGSQRQDTAGAGAAGGQAPGRPR